MCSSVYHCMKGSPIYCLRSVRIRIKNETTYIHVNHSQPWWLRRLQSPLSSLKLILLMSPGLLDTRHSVQIGVPPNNGDPRIAVHTCYTAYSTYPKGKRCNAAQVLNSLSQGEGWGLISAVLMLWPHAMIPIR